MKDIAADPKLIAYCGLYCGACGRYRKDSCPGCQQNQKASWCKVRTCCMDGNLQSCADGYQAFAEEMAAAKRQTIAKR